MLRAVAESAIPPPDLASSLPTAGSLPKDRIARDLGRCLAVFDMRGPYARYARRRPAGRSGSRTANPRPPGQTEDTHRDRALRRPWDDVGSRGLEERQQRRAEGRLTTTPIVVTMPTASCAGGDRYAAAPRGGATRRCPGGDRRSSVARGRHPTTRRAEQIPLRGSVSDHPRRCSSYVRRTFRA